jgi:hypothetical protein
MNARPTHPKHRRRSPSRGQDYRSSSYDRRVEPRIVISLGDAAMQAETVNSMAIFESLFRSLS